MSTPRISNNQHEGMIAQSTISGNQEFVKSTSGALNITGTVTATVDTSLLATAAKQDTGNSSLSTIAGAITSSVVQDNLKQVNGATVNVGTGTASTGTQRVAVASDSSINVVQSGIFSVYSATNTGSAVPAQAHYVGGIASTANPTAATGGNLVGFTTDKLGKQVTVGSIRTLKGTQQTSIASSTAETTIVTADATNFLDIYRLVITNTSTTGTKVTIKDSTAGTTRYIFWIPANETRGFSGNESAAINQATANNNWTATCGTSVANIEITADYVKNL